MFACFLLLFLNKYFSILTRSESLAVAFNEFFFGFRWFAAGLCQNFLTKILRVTL